MLAAASRGEATRRRRRAGLLLRWLAPGAAALGLVWAVAGRAAGLPVIALGTGLVLVLAGVCLAAFVVGRTRAVTDGTARQLDADAGLGGELRSARWFAAEGDDDPWTRLHLERAAARLEPWDWRAAYPKVRARASWLGAGLLAAGAVLATMQMPVGAPIVSPAIADVRPADDMPPLKPEELEQLDALLAKLNLMRLTPEEAKKLAELSEKLANSDLARDGSLAELMKKLQEQAERAAAKPRGDDSDTGDRPADSMKNAEELRQALEELKSRLASDRPVDESREAAAGQSADQSERGDSASQASTAESSLRMVREPASEAGRGQAKLGGGTMGGDSGPGRGGEGLGRGAGRGVLLTQDMLRRELVEANADTRGSNVPIEDIRRKTEQSSSTLGFTRVAPRGAYDRSRTAPPPPVPDARRSWLQQYFVRK